MALHFKSLHTKKSEFCARCFVDNLCCVIQSIYRLGIESDFFGREYMRTLLIFLHPGDLELTDWLLILFALGLFALVIFGIPAAIVFAVVRNFHKAKEDNGLSIIAHKSDRD